MEIPESKTELALTTNNNDLLKDQVWKVNGYRTFKQSLISCLTDLNIIDALFNIKLFLVIVNIL